MEICKKNNCTGCCACMNICPKGAIEMTADEYGKTISHIDPNKCISCGLCAKICPAEKEVKLQRAACSYAVYSKNDIDRKLSSSGGAAAVFTRYTLQKGGCVFGAASQRGMTRQICAETAEEAESLRGSKYVQSYVGYSYRETKKQLEAGRTVLYTGTPCQIAGLRAYLRKEYDNLITVDLICHGTPPHKYLEEHITAKLKGKEWDSCSFRGKYDYFLSIYDKDSVLYKVPREQDEYFMAFFKALTFRDNCYSCKYARPERISDITIGDFWGINRNSLKNKYSGRISLVLPNTPKGEKFFKSCRDSFIWEKRTFEEAANPAQGNLLRPSKIHAERGLFLKLYREKSFEKAVRGTRLGREAMRRRTRSKIKGIIKRIPGVIWVKRLIVWRR